MKRRTGSTRTKDLAWQPGGTTARQMTTLVLVLIVAIVLLPLGAQAAQTVSAIITDPGGNDQAEVDHGSLRTTSADDPGRMAYTDQRLVHILSGSFDAIVNFDVPDGKRLVITHVSGEIPLPAGQKVRTIGMNVHTGTTNGVHVFVPTLTTATTAGVDFFLFSQDTTIYADDGFTIQVLRDATGGEVDATVAVSGYLIDCTAAPCN